MHHEKCTTQRVWDRRKIGRVDSGEDLTRVKSRWIEWTATSRMKERKKKKKEQTTEVLFVGDRIRLFVYTADQRWDSPIVPQGIASIAFPSPGVPYRANNDLSGQIGLTRNQVKRD